MLIIIFTIKPKELPWEKCSLLLEKAFAILTQSYPKNFADCVFFY